MRIILRVTSVKVILAKKNRTYTWFANKINTTPQYVSALLKGKKSPSPDTRIKIQRTLNGHTWDELFELQRNDETTTTDSGVR